MKLQTPSFLSHPLCLGLPLCTVAFNPNSLTPCPGDPPQDPPHYWSWLPKPVAAKKRLVASLAPSPASLCYLYPPSREGWIRFSMYSLQRRK